MKTNLRTVNMFGGVLSPICAIGGDWRLGVIRDHQPHPLTHDECGAVIKRISDQENEPRCPECGGEISACGPMTSDGPSDDCRACQLQSRCDALSAVLSDCEAALRAFIDKHRFTSRYNSADFAVLEAALARAEKARKGNT